MYFAIRIFLCEMTMIDTMLMDLVLWSEYDCKNGRFCAQYEKYQNAFYLITKNMGLQLVFIANA